MITLKKLKWGGLFSYGDDNEIDFTANTITQVLGQNGNGKSSIALILEEALYNKNSKGIKKADIPNRYGDGSYWINLTFSRDDIEYEVDIQRKSSLKIKLYADKKDISSHTATNTFKTIEEIMSIDFKMFSQLVNQNINTSLQFLTATDTNRKKFLIELLKLDKYVEQFELFKEQAKKQAGEVAVIQGKVDTIQTWISQNTLDDYSIKEILDTEAFDVTAEERERTKLAAELQNIERTNRQIANNNQNRELLSSIDIDAIQQIDAQQRSYDDQQTELGGLESNIRRVTAYVTKIESLGQVCPTCEQTIEEDFKAKLVANEKEELETLRNQQKLLRSVIEEIKAENARFAKKQEQIKEWESLFRSIDKNLPQQPLNKQEIEDQITNLTLKISNNKAKLQSIIQHNQEAAKHNSRVQIVSEQSDKLVQELTQHQEALNQASETLTHLEVLKKALSPNGFVAYKIENQVKDLEELANEYLAELSDGRFTLEFSVASDKLNVIIGDNGHPIEITALSSGELARVNTATLLGLRKLMNSISKSRVNLLFLDEVISALDEPGREKLVEVLLGEQLNTFVVSHGWQHPLLSKLEVVKENEISRIEQE